MRILDNINNALSFTSIIKIPFYTSNKKSYDHLQDAISYFPITGIIIGLIHIGVIYFLKPFTKFHIFSAIFLTITYMIFTRALHLDGLVDCTDAMPAYSREKRLEILKDSRLGVFGGLALFFALTLRLNIYLYILKYNLNPFFILIPYSLSRSLFILLTYSNYPRKKGTAMVFVGHTNLKHFIIAMLITALTFPVFPLKNTLFIVISLIIWNIILKYYFEYKIGGITGDVLGTSIETTEILGLLISLFAI